MRYKLNSRIIFSASNYERNAAVPRTVVQQDMRIVFVLSEGDAAVIQRSDRLIWTALWEEMAGPLVKQCNVLVNSGGWRTGNTAQSAWSTF
jgi:hypothetical protein